MSIFELTTCVELGLIFGIVAIGIYLTFRVIDFPDLTCDGSFVLGAATAGVLLKAGVAPWLAMLIATTSGALAGIGTGILHVYFKMTNLLASILMAFMLYSINLKVMQNIPNIALIDNVTIFSKANPLLVLIIVTVLCAGIIGFLLLTDIGLGIRSVGQNQRLAQNCGVSISKMTLITLAISNGLIALSGALFSQHQGFADISQGVGTIIIGLAAVMIGEKIMPARNIWYAITACIMGSIIYRIVVASALHSDWLGLQTQDLNLITGMMVIAIMLLPKMRKRKINATT